MTDARHDYRMPSREFSDAMRLTDAEKLARFGTLDADSIAYAIEERRAIQAEPTMKEKADG